MVSLATLQDINDIIRMLLSFGDASPISAFHNPVFNHRGVSHTITKFITDGVALVATDEDDRPVGMLLAMGVPDIWLPEIVTLREIAWWVDPEARSTSLGFRLFREYVKIGKQLVASGQVNNFVLTLLANSPAIDLEKRGFEAVETNYVYKGE